MLSWLAAVLVGAGSPSPLPTLPPEIYHSVTRPLCSSLKDRIEPALGLMIQNDATIAKSVPYFQDYIKRSTEGSDAGRDIAVLHMEDLVTPLVDNTLAVQKLLNDPSVFPPAARTSDDATLLKIKTQMLKVLAAQEASLDLINGFVTTEQLGQLQSEGMEYISSLSASQSSGVASPQPVPTAMGYGQGFDDLALKAGLPPDPYQIDLTQIPGLAMGYNPISAIKEGVVWTQGRSRREADPLSKTVTTAAHACGAPAASPSPKP